MDRTVYTFVAEPEGLTYQSLLDAALKFCDTALLVVRDRRQISAEAESTMAQLQPFERERVQASEWPGTILHGGKALVITYSFGPECASVLKDLSKGLYSWQHPDRPEDLCLLRPDRTPWLVSIAHERDAYLRLTNEEHKALLAKVPEIGHILSAD